MSAARRVRGVTLAVALALVAGACTHARGVEDPPGAGAGPDRSSEPESIAVTTRVTRVAGDLPDARRQQVRREIAAVLEGYLDAAFLGSASSGPLGTAFPGFTPGARSLAAKDAAVLTRAGFDEGDRVSADVAHARVTVLSPHGRAVGATAQISARFDLSSEEGTRTATLSGRLLFSPTRHGWRIFGYHLASSGAGASS